MAALSSRAKKVLDLPLVALESGSVHDLMSKAKSVVDPEDVIDLGLAENKLCEDIINEKLKECYPTSNSTQYYTTAYGLESLRKTFAGFLTRHMKAVKEVDPEQLIVTTGCTSLLGIVSMGIADSGEYIMVPCPYYYRLGMDLRSLGGLELLHAPMPENGVSLSDSLEATYTKAQSEVRCSLHVVMDEIYGLSVFGESKFESVFTLDTIPDPERTHFMWGLSKDFGMSGYRIGVLHSWSKSFIQYVRRIIDAFQVPTFIQLQMNTFLSDTDWIDNVLLRTYQDKLISSFQYTKEKLSSMDVSVHPKCQGGLFVWANFSKHMKSKSFEEEEKLMAKLYTSGVSVLNGGSFKSSEPGWFRIIFTTRPHLLEEGIYYVLIPLE
ncbi:hypothetical protein FSP39_024699 [Pinctada imbricata]|uniref:Aminotransferase class I/classII large domain-containing protein n=1 Tax=Pinctada imbricata TaxID=66713 RepID=A0AA89BV67_PINIB|nr:hypothetical protein FSP39_024699 [Pinctada imbricata]